MSTKKKQPEARVGAKSTADEQPTLNATMQDIQTLLVQNPQIRVLLENIVLRRLYQESQQKLSRVNGNQGSEKNDA